MKNEKASAASTGVDEHNGHVVRFQPLSKKPEAVRQTAADKRERAYLIFRCLMLAAVVAGILLVYRAVNAAENRRQAQHQHDVYARTTAGFHALLNAYPDEAGYLEIKNRLFFETIPGLAALNNAAVTQKAALIKEHLKLYALPSLLTAVVDSFLVQTKKSYHQLPFLHYRSFEKPEDSAFFFTNGYRIYRSFFEIFQSRKSFLFREKIDTTATSVRTLLADNRQVAGRALALAKKMDEALIPIRYYYEENTDPTTLEEIEEFQTARLALDSLADNWHAVKTSVAQIQTKHYRLIASLLQELESLMAKSNAALH